MKTEFFIAERKSTEQSLLDSEQRYKRLLACVTDYVYTVTVEHGRPLATSHGQGCEAVTGYTPAEFYADPFLWYRMIHEEDRPAVLAQAERVLGDKRRRRWNIGSFIRAGAYAGFGMCRFPARMVRAGRFRMMDWSPTSPHGSRRRPRCGRVRNG